MAIAVQDENDNCQRARHRRPLTESFAREAKISLLHIGNFKSTELLERSKTTRGADCGLSTGAFYIYVKCLRGEIYLHFCLETAEVRMSVCRI